MKQVCKLFAVLLFAFLLASCGDPAAPTCKSYCLKAEDCMAKGDKMFSMYECREECKMSIERHESIGCGYAMREYFRCLVKVPCERWLDWAPDCSKSLQEINRCIEENT